MDGDFEDGGRDHIIACDKNLIVKSSASDFAGGYCYLGIDQGMKVFVRMLVRMRTVF